MIFSFSAEWIKIRRTFFKVVLYISPILFNLMIFGYIFLTNQTIFDSKFYYNYFSILNFLLPATICFLLSLMNNCEREAGNFKNIFGLSYNYYFILTQKLIFSYLIISFMYFLNSLITIIMLKFIFNVHYNILYSYFIYGFTLTWITFITSFIIYFFLSIICSFITSIIIGLTSSLLTAIIGLTVLGNKIWMFFPITWGARFIMFKIDNWSLITFIYQYNYWGYIILFCPIICFLLLMIICVFLFRR